MTEKNAHVEWLRGVLGSIPSTASGALDWLEDFKLGLLAHIDQLEADIREARNEWESACERAEGAKAVLYDLRPTVHEIALRQFSAFGQHAGFAYGKDYKSRAAHAYDAAEALVAEGRRRDGL